MGRAGGGSGGSRSSGSRSSGRSSGSRSFSRTRSGTRSSTYSSSRGSSSSGGSHGTYNYDNSYFDVQEIENLNRLNECIQMPVYDGKILFPESDKEAQLIDRKVSDMKHIIVHSKYVFYVASPVIGGFVGTELFAFVKSDTLYNIGLLFCGVCGALCAYVYHKSRLSKLDMYCNKLYDNVDKRRAEYETNLQNDTLPVYNQEVTPLPDSIDRYEEMDNYVQGIYVEEKNPVDVLKSNQDYKNFLDSMDEDSKKFYKQYYSDKDVKYDWSYNSEKQNEVNK